MESIFDSIHIVDLEKGTFEKKSAREGAMVDYIVDLIKKSRLNKNKRSFKFASDKVEVYTLIMEMINSGFSIEKMEQNTHRIAERWFQKESDTQERYGHFMRLQKGSLIQSFFQTRDSYLFLIAKVEHEDYLDEAEFNRQIGLPFENRILKTCIVELKDFETSFKDHDSGEPIFEIDNIYVTDSNDKIPAYWYKDFLELESLNTNEMNTRTAFKSFDSEIRKVRKISPPDYTLLRNNLIGYFKTKEDFTMDNAIDYIFGDYLPELPELNIDKIIENIRALPEKKKFDTQFSIVKKEVKARRYYDVNDKIEIRIKDHVDGLRDVVYSKEERGEKFIVIKTENDEVFKLFQYKDENR